MLDLARAEEEEFKVFPTSKVSKINRQQAGCQVGKKHQAPHAQAIASVSTGFHFSGSRNKTVVGCV